ncbi:hypothetical protein AYI69_g8430 [Smittium culicis]|uniref:Uncharacterized protein n=1 Tax=Smittium culicis TaxID=133412 RepID=A0A1R1XJJ3_9FUNG|nr:hypothetical protein AYI69_g8430 [Smittium culicis]
MQLRRSTYKFTGKTAISGIFDTWEVDFVGPFPESELGNKYIFTGIERQVGILFQSQCPAQQLRLHWAAYWR